MPSYASADTRSRKPVATGSDGADGMAVASFVLGLIGLLAFNVVLGPLSLVLGLVSLVRGTQRPVRAILGVVLGVADLVVYIALVAFHGGSVYAPFGI
jgi:hypothetical protein